MKIRIDDKKVRKKPLHTRVVKLKSKNKIGIAIQSQKLPIDHRLVSQNRITNKRFHIRIEIKIITLYRSKKIKKNKDN